MRRRIWWRDLGGREARSLTEGVGVLTRGVDGSEDAREQAAARDIDRLSREQGDLRAKLQEAKNALADLHRELGVRANRSVRPTLT